MRSIIQWLVTSVAFSALGFQPRHSQQSLPHQLVVPQERPVFASSNAGPRVKELFGVGSRIDTTTEKDPKLRKTRSARSETGPIHWTLESDLPATVVWANSSAMPPIPSSSLVNNTTVQEVEMVHFTIRGPPKPLVRHRLSTMRMYNPSAKSQESFRQVLNQTLMKDLSHMPIFPNQTLAVTIAFRMKRPKSHFLANRPGADRLRPSAPQQTSITRSDVDNLAKFVLDSLNGCMYEDDRQVASLHVTKLLDNEGDCLGATEVRVRVMREVDLHTLLHNSFRLF